MADARVRDQFQDRFDHAETRAEHRHDDDGGLVGRAYARLIYLGLVKPPRDFDAFHRALRERGLTTRFGDRTRAPAGRRLDDMERAVERIRSLVPAARVGDAGAAHTSKER